MIYSRSHFLGKGDKMKTRFENSYHGGKNLTTLAASSAVRIAPHPENSLHHSQFLRYTFELGLRAVGTLAKGNMNLSKSRQCSQRWGWEHFFELYFGWLMVI